MAHDDVSLTRAALTCRCPRCGEGRLFSGLLTIRDRCPACGLDLRGHDAGDGPAVGVIFLLSTVIMGAALWVEFRFGPPVWVHLLVWPVLAIGGAIAVMRPLKAAVVGLQYRHRSSEMGL